MLTARSTLMRRVNAALDASPSRIPVLLGGCGSGRTTLAHELRDWIGRTSVQYVDVEHSATTPERFQQAVVTTSPFAPTEPAGDSARAAFGAALAFMNSARSPGSQPATFVLDEFLEVQ